MKTLLRTIYTIAILSIAFVGKAAISTPAELTKVVDGSDAFSGYYHGTYVREVRGVKKSYSVKVSLTQNGNEVTGEFTFKDGKGMISNGKIIGNKLIFTWKEAGLNGTGQFIALHNNQLLTGQWNGSYQTKGSASKGTLELFKE